MYKKIFSLLGIVLLLPGCWSETKRGVEYNYQETIQDEVPFNMQGTVNVDLDVGDITIRGWEQGLVAIEGTKYAATQDALTLLEPNLKLSDKKVEVRTNIKRYNVEGFINYHIKAPYGSRIKEIENKAGNVTIEDIRGEIEIETASGVVSISGARSDVEVETKAGNITLSFGDGAVAKADIESKSGDVEITNAFRDVEVKTDSGSISIVQGDLAQGKIEAQSRSGRIRVNNAMTDLKLESSSGSLLVNVSDIRPETSMKLDTKSGRVTVMLPREVNVRINARTESGTINTSLPLEKEKQSAVGVIGNHIDTKSELSIHTTSGDITIQSR